MKSLLLLICAGGLASYTLSAQQSGVATQARASDWEEVNFETNQAVIVDGFPSLLRLAELLKGHPDYKVTIVGYADQRGSASLNDALSLRRANAVGQFLQKYGAAAGQLQMRGNGKRDLEDSANNLNARFINRRVAITVTGPSGSTVGDGSIGTAIDDFTVYSRSQLGKVDTILAQLQQLEAQLRALNTADIKQDTVAIKQDTTAIRQDTTAIRQDTGTLVQRPAPLSSDQTTQIANAAARQGADYALLQSALRNRKYSLVGFDFGPALGPGRIGDYTASAFGKALIPFGNGKTPEQAGTHGFVAEGSWTYVHPNPRRTSSSIGVDGVNDALFSTGLVNRFGHTQIGTFAQFDYASLGLAQFAGPGTAPVLVTSRGGTLLSGGVATFDFVMPFGTVGIFGAKGFRDNAIIASSSATPVRLRYTDQAGMSVAGTFHQFQIEGNVAWVKQYIRGFDAMPSASAKVSFGATDALQFYVEADANSTFANAPYPTQRIAIGVQFGNWVRARNYRDTQSVVPTTIPHPRYELLPR